VGLSSTTYLPLKFERSTVVVKGHFCHSYLRFQTIALRQCFCTVHQACIQFLESALQEANMISYGSIHSRHHWGVQGTLSTPVAKQLE